MGSVHYDNGIHEAVEVADTCVDIVDASHFAKVVQFNGFGVCS